MRWRFLDSPLIGTAATLVLAALGAAVFRAFDLPAPYLTGPATLVTAASLAHVPTQIPVRLRDVVFLVIGVGIGSSVTPETLRTIATWPLSFLGLAVTLVALLAACPAYLHRVCGYGRRDAVLAATPGHLSYVLALTEESGGDSGRVALVQSMRVLFLVLLVPMLLTLLDMEAGTAPPPVPPMPLTAFAAVTLAAFGAGLILKRLRLPAALLLGGMGVSSVCHATELTSGGLPAGIGPVAFAVMGALIGTRFSGRSVAEVTACLRDGFGVTFIACAVASVGAFAVAFMLGLDPAVMLISFAPGGVEAMAAMAILIGAEPAFVAGHHVFRLMVLLIILPVFLRRADRAQRARSAGTGRGA